MVDFISEVQEELRKDDYNKFLKKYGPFIVVLIAAAVMATGYMEWRKSTDDRTARATSAAYISASTKAEEGDVDLAIREFIAIADQAPSGYSGLSLMRAAELELNRGDTAKAIGLLDQAASTFENARHAQLAQIKAAYVLAGEGRYDDVRVRVAALAEKDQPYEYLARELLGFAAMEKGDDAAAREQFSYLKNIPGVPETIQQRAIQYLSLMSVGAEADTPVPTEDDAQDAPAIEDVDAVQAPEPETEDVE